ncbi:hypothetical protein ACFFKU_06960 [Kineococcus gynurae]|uniref:Uncharacterized protein n=1 Tax=Kineococcus gynurae TaxID=452979 RepID=A0ABV5LWV4_9ACTN
MSTLQVCWPVIDEALLTDPTALCDEARADLPAVAARHHAVLDPGARPRVRLVPADQAPVDLGAAWVVVAEVPARDDRTPVVVEFPSWRAAS